MKAGSRVNPEPDQEELAQAERNERLRERTRLAIDVVRLAERGWVSLPELADLLGVSVQTVYAMRDNDNFRYVVVGAHARVYLEEVRRLLLHGNLQDDPHEQAASKAEGI